MPLLKFKEWDQINEASLFDRIKNWFSSSFGGSIEKLNEYLKSYQDLEMRFVDEWEEIKVETDKLKLEREQTKSDPAERKKIDRMLERNADLVRSAVKVHEKSTDELFLKVKKHIEGNKRLQDYWESNKLRIDAEIAEDMYKIAKKLTDSSEADKLYDKYRESVLKARKKDEDFREEYGKLIDFTKQEDETKKVSSKGLSVKHVGGTESSFELLSKLSIIEFANAISDFDKDQSKKLVSYLIKERNDLYVAMDMERDLLNTEIEKMPNDHKTREYASSKLKEIREKYLEKIRELRSKITVAKKNA